MKKVLVILTAVALFATKNTKAQTGFQLGFYKTDNHATSDWKQFMYDGLDGKDLSSYDSWFTIPASDAFQIYVEHIKHKFQGYDVRDVVNESAEADLTKDMLHPNSVGYINRSTKKQEWGNRLTGVHPGEKRLEFLGISYLLPRCGNIYSWDEQPNFKQNVVQAPKSNPLGWTTSAGTTLNLNTNSNTISNSGWSKNDIKIENKPVFDIHFDGLATATQQPSNVVASQPVVQQPAVQYVTAPQQNCCVEQPYIVANPKVPFGQTFGGQLLANFGGAFAANTVDHWLFPDKAPQNNYYVVGRRGRNNGNNHNGPGPIQGSSGGSTGSNPGLPEVPGTAGAGNNSGGIQ